MGIFHFLCHTLFLPSFLVEHDYQLWLLSFSVSSQGRECEQVGVGVDSHISSVVGYVLRTSQSELFPSVQYRSIVTHWSQWETLITGKMNIIMGAMLLPERGFCDNYLYMYVWCEVHALLPSKYVVHRTAIVKMHPWMLWSPPCTHSNCTGVD